MAYKRNSPGIFEPFELTRRSRGCLYDRSITHLFEQSFLLVHSPRAGRDQGRALPGQTSSISIHSPRAGRDSPRSRDRRRQPNFNPLAPCGARREREYKAALGELFQSTRPVRGETCAALAPSGSSRHFNPLAPCGARPPAIWIYDCSEAFQSTRPVRGETQPSYAVRCTESISIHSPRAGRDCAACWSSWRP